MSNPTQPMNKEELREEIVKIVNDMAPDYDDELLKLILADRNAAIREAQDEVINKAHTPCECGKGHYGAVVRSVQGGITTYCPFSKIVLQSQPNAKEEE